MYNSKATKTGGKSISNSSLRVKTKRIMLIKADIWLFLLSLLAVVAGAACYAYGLYGNGVLFLTIGLGYSVFVAKNQKEKHLGH